MMKYERLTERDTKGFAVYKRKCNSDNIGENLYIQGMREEEVLNRLAELEDKIENGTLIELPCKVGDTIYWISSNNRDIIEVFVKRIALAEQDRTILYVEEKGFEEYTIMFVNDIFLTREEAEAKLKELQE